MNFGKSGFDKGKVSTDDGVVYLNNAVGEADSADADVVAANSGADFAKVNSAAGA